jgi:exodeoxyribonuclease VII small subunit
VSRASEPNAPPVAGRESGGARPAEPAAAAPEPYEVLVARLEKVVGELESGGLSLEQSLARFADGMNLAREAQQKLDEAERRIEKLVRSADGGEEAVPLEGENGSA